MKKTLPVIVLFVLFLSCCHPAAGQYSLNERLGDANSHGDLKAFQFLLDEGANIETTGHDGYKILTLAVVYDHVEIVKLLLERGANIEATTSIRYDGTPLIWAAGVGGDVEIVKLLLERGANIEARTNVSQETPLMLAAQHGRIEIMNLLLEKGANIEAVDAYGDTPLMGAVDRKQISAAKLLLNKGANIDAESNNHTTVMELADKYGPAEMVDLLAQTRRQREPQVQAKSKSPQEAFVVYVSLLQKNPQDDALRDKVFTLANGFPAPPAIPEEARQLFVLATDQIKQATTPAALDQPIALLRKVLEIAPWWGNAYFNLSRALEMRGQYDDAARQLNYYLELKPAEADASEARAHLVVIQAEKDAAAHKQ